MSNATTEKVTPETVEVGQAFTHTIHTDSVVYHVEQVQRNGKTLILRKAHQKILNAPDSGEPDALNFSPGGFVGHTSGRQRWKVEPNPEGRILKATWRESRGFWKPTGTRTKSPGNSVRAGSFPHYDYNF